MPKKRELGRCSFCRFFTAEWNGDEGTCQHPSPELHDKRRNSHYCCWQFLLTGVRG